MLVPGCQQVHFQLLSRLFENFRHNFHQISLLDGLYSTFLLASALNGRSLICSVQRPDGRTFQIIEVGLIVEHDFAGKRPAGS